jgi:hypothetical protein
MQWTTLCGGFLIAAIISWSAVRGAPPEIPAGRLLLWDGDTPESSVINQHGKVSDERAPEGKCLEAVWPPRPKQTNPVIVFGESRPDIDLTGYDEIWFFAKASEEGKTFDVDLSQWSGRKARANIDAYIDGGKLTTEWKLVKIPLERCTKSDTWQGQVDHIVFPSKTKDRTKLPKILWLDEVYAVKRPR